MVLVIDISRVSTGKSFLLIFRGVLDLHIRPKWGEKLASPTLYFKRQFSRKKFSSSGIFFSDSGFRVLGKPSSNVNIRIRITSLSSLSFISLQDLETEKLYPLMTHVMDLRTWTSFFV